MIIDMHCDTLAVAFRNHRPLNKESQEGQADLPRMRKGGVGIQFFAMFAAGSHPSEALADTLQLLDYFWEEYQANSDLMQPVLAPEDLDRCLASGKTGAFLTIEGGEALAGSLRVLHILYRLGVRGLGLTWNHRNQLADGIAESRTGGGLTRFGAEVVKTMNRLGMVIDVSHLSEKGFWDVLELSDYPVIASHSNCRAIWEHPRNLSDEQISALAQKGGIMGVNFVPDFLGPAGAGLDDLIRHIEHICELVGDDYVGFGSDFDGIKYAIPEVPDIAHYPVIIGELQRRGFGRVSLNKLCHQNCLRVLKKILK